ncbi:MAG: hypothetical protein ACRC8Y_20865 [Chroococcales cyanobacterium]
MKIFQCQKKDHKQFTSFFSYVSVFNETRCIANHYYAAKVFKSPTGTVIFPEDWKESRKWGNAGVRQIGWKIGDFILPLRMNNKGYKIDDFGVQWYILLWYKHLRENPEKLEYLQQFDKFNDSYKNKSFPFGQPDIMLKVKQDGLNNLRSMASELWNLLSGEPIIHSDLLDIKYGAICHQVNQKGVMDSGLANQIWERYPIVYEKYLEFLPTAKLGDVLVVPIDKCLSVVNLFAQNEIGLQKQQTDMSALRTCLLKLGNLQGDKPIYLPCKLGCGLGDGDWNKVRLLINRFNRAIICHK